MTAQTATRFQFSLRLLLIMVALVALACFVARWLATSGGADLALTLSLGCNLCSLIALRIAVRSSPAQASGGDSAVAASPFVRQLQLLLALAWLLSGYFFFVSIAAKIITWFTIH